MVRILRRSGWFIMAASVSVVSSSVAAGTEQTTTKPAAVDPEVEAILDRLEKAGQAIHDLQVAVRYQMLDLVIGDTIIKTGQILFRKEKPNPKFLIRFDETRQEDVRDRSKEWHLFDGRWYIEAHEKTKSIIKREIVPPGKHIEPFRIGKGPFPLPFGQKKQEILEHFDATLVPPKPGDPPRTDHLLCVPLKASSMAQEYKRLEFFVSRKVDLPVKIIAHRKSDDKQITVGFPGLEDRDKHINTGFAGSRVGEGAIAAGRDWSVHSETLPPEPPPQP